MRKVVILSGSHRNEKTAAILAKQVADKLKLLGHDIDSAENPETRTLLEIALDAYKNGERLKKRDLEIIIQTEKKKNWTHDFYVPSALHIDFHNYNINPTENSPPGWHKAYLKAMEEQFSGLDDGPLKNDRLAHDIMFYVNINPSRIPYFILLEIPAVYKDKLTPQQKFILSRVVHSKTLKKFVGYSYDVDVNASIRAGLVGKRMTDTLTTGIDYLITTGLNHRKYS